MSTSLTTSEQLIWKKIKAAKNGLRAQAMTQAQLESGLPGMRVKEAQSSIASLISMKLLVTSTLKDGTTLFKAAEPDAAVKKNTLTDEQKIVLHVITQAGNKGLNSKQIRAQVPNSIIPNALRKALEILEKNEHVKTFRSVNAPTTILYCAFHFEPPIEITGGVWYDDSKEYDHTLVEAISLFLLKYVQNKIAKMPPSHLALVPNPIFPVGRTKNLPSPAQLLKALTLSEITPAKLKIKNIMEVMRKLELDGLIEVVKPLDGVAAAEDDEESDHEPTTKRRKVESDDGMDSDERERKEEKEKEKAREKAKAKRKKEKERERQREKEKAKEKKRRKREKEKEREKQKRKEKEKDKKRKRVTASDGDESEDESDELRTIDEVRRKEKKSKSKSSKSKRKYRSSPEDSSDVSSSEDDSDDSESDTEDSVSATLSDSSVDSDNIDSKRLTSKPSANNFSSSKQGLTPAGMLDLSDTAIVYRALNRMSAPLGQTEISCGKCPAFNFCEEDGPVNPAGCEYLDDWLFDQKGGWEVRPSDEARGVGSKGKKKRVEEDIEDEEYADEMVVDE